MLVIRIRKLCWNGRGFVRDHYVGTVTSEVELLGLVRGVYLLLKYDLGHVSYMILDLREEVGL